MAKNKQTFASESAKDNNEQPPEQTSTIMDTLINNWAHDRLSNRIHVVCQAVLKYLSVEHVNWILSQSDPNHSIIDAIERARQHEHRDYYSEEQNNAIRILNMTTYTNLLALYENAYTKKVLIKMVRYNMDRIEKQNALEAASDEASESNDQ